MPRAPAKPRNPPEHVASDNDAQLGTFVSVVSGPHKGRYGVFHSVGEERAGWPVTAVVRTRDAEDEHLIVDYGDLRPDVPGKR